jgi:hypothetical protein
MQNDEETKEKEAKRLSKQRDIAMKGNEEVGKP